MKTRIQIASDLHIEFTGMDAELDTVAEQSRDILIVAGDLAEGTRGFDWLTYQTQFSEVVFVPGNHEYYGHDIDDVDRKFRAFEKTNSRFHFLQLDIVELYGVRIAGCTLWTDMMGLSDWDKRMVEKSMSDFHCITKRGARFTPQISNGINMGHRNWLMLQKDIDIVVTHHAPSDQSITPYWQEHGKLLNPGFAGNSDDIIHALQPKFWIHGHMHSFLRYWHDQKINGTQVICNPRGYGGSYQERTGFDDNFMISLEKDK
jgi:Icc-related predicted phosphoesterase